MKALLIGLCLLLPSVSYAAPDSDDYCRALSGLARSMMYARQDNVPISQVLQLAKSDANQKEFEMYQSLIIEAYDEVVWGTPDYKERAVNEFEASVYIRCINVLME